MTATFGAIAIDASVGGPTVRANDAVSDPLDAEMLAVPCAAAVTSPPVVTVAMVVVAEVQDTWAVISAFEPSLNVPVA